MSEQDENPKTQVECDPSEVMALIRHHADWIGKRLDFKFGKAAADAIYDRTDRINTLCSDLQDMLAPTPPPADDSDIPF